MTTRGSRAAAGLAAAIVLVPAAVCGVHWWHHDRQRRHVPIPAANSTPVDVAEACVAASDAHDGATLRAIGGCGLGGLTSVRLVGLPLPAADDPNGDVRVGLNLEVRGGGASFPDGERGWDLYLRQGGPAGWMIVAAGQG